MLILSYEDHESMHWLDCFSFVKPVDVYVQGSTTQLLSILIYGFDSAPSNTLFFSSVHSVTTLAGFLLPCEKSVSVSNQPFCNEII